MGFSPPKKISPKIKSSPNFSNLFFVGWNLDKFQLEKYDFHLCKGFFTERMTQIRQILKGKQIPNCQIVTISSSR
jgi:hypothetical protein